MCDIWLSSSWDSEEVGSTKGLTLLSCLMFSCSCFICFCVFLVFFLSSSLGLLSPYLRTWLSTSKPPPDLCPFCPSTSLCSGDSPEQLSAATWQRASPVLSLSGDHQWDLHPCACAKLAGGLPQSHTRHYGVCVASPIHLHLSSPPFTVFLLSVWSVLLAVMSKMLRFIPTILSVFPSLLFQESRAAVMSLRNPDKDTLIYAAYIPFLVASSLLSKLLCISNLISCLNSWLLKTSWLEREII